MKSIKWILVVVLGVMSVGTCYGVTLRWDTPVKGLSVGVDKGIPVTVYNIEKTTLAGGYSTPVVLYEIPDSISLLNGYNVSLEVGVVGDAETLEDIGKTDILLGLGTNAPEVLVQKGWKNLTGNDLPLVGDRIKIAVTSLVDTQRLIDEHELVGDLSVMVGVKVLEW